MSRSIYHLKSLVLLLFLMHLSLSGSAWAGAVNFTVSPSIVEFETVKGAVKMFPLSLYNQGTNPLEVQMTVRGFQLDPKGVSHLLPTGEGSHNWSRRVSLSARTFTVKPGESHKVTATLKVPRDKRGGGYFAVVFHARPKTGKKRTGGVVLGAQAATLFIGEISRTGTRRGRIRAAELSPGPYSSKNPLAIRLQLENTGTTHLRAKGSIVLRNQEGKVVDRIRLESGSGLILPGGRRYFQGTWPRAQKYLQKKITADIRFLFKGGNTRTQLPLPLDLKKQP